MRTPRDRTTLRVDPLGGLTITDETEASIYLLAQHLLKPSACQHRLHAMPCLCTIITATHIGAFDPNRRCRSFAGLVLQCLSVVSNVNLFELDAGGLQSCLCSATVW